ncbi:serine/threonine protein kinase [Gloeothece citriformis PCC 7424]|uniref:non-specific serine/threonine protein kinase n=1 Tax=Gloeothece citriformis (strain PCC 7424) TaxID=65393 RepID=B7K9X6_GLOC7|nr:IMS domain-containing protein [Gloeothece citriformis]ACK71332.1 serine/threonine protein kinase [Gloeothece citriformis PCC 7424]
MNTILKDRYKILQTIAQGGFGETFLAEDTHMPSGRRCLVKQLKPINNEPQVYQLVQQRFQREAAILEELGRISSQIPQLYAYFESDGQFYLVEEFIEGETLTAKVQSQGIFSESQVRAILMSLLEVLIYVHSKHIIHRDIKPDNIILRQPDGLPILIDFGAVKESMGTVVSPSGNSAQSIVIGTPGYMPSEQAAGRPVYSSDLYGLGLTMIYLLTGKIPQELDTDLLTGETRWRQYALNISPTLGLVLDKSIQPHLRDRFLTATEMLSALQNQTTPVPSTIVSPPIAAPATVVTAAPTASTVMQPVSSRQGLAEWQKAIVTGSIIGSFLLAALLVNHYLTTSKNDPPSPPISQETPPEPSPIAVSPTPITSPNAVAPSPTFSPQETFEPTPEPSYIAPSPLISQAEAVNLIERWQTAKREIFGSNHAIYLGDEFLTGKAYHENIRRTDGQESSSEWLLNNGSYYQYGVQSVDSVQNLASSGNQAILEVVITEERTLYDSNGNIDYTASGFDTRLVRYYLQLENGQWKISDYQTIKVIREN